MNVDIMPSDFAQSYYMMLSEVIQGLKLPLWVVPYQLLSIAALTDSL